MQASDGLIVGDHVLVAALLDVLIQELECHEVFLARPRKRWSRRNDLAHPAPAGHEALVSEVAAEPFERLPEIALGDPLPQIEACVQGDHYRPPARNPTEPTCKFHGSVLA